jgi:hypothetical protein
MGFSASGWTRRSRRRVAVEEVVWSEFGMSRILLGRSRYCSLKVYVPPRLRGVVLALLRSSLDLLHCTRRLGSYKLVHLQELTGGRGKGGGWGDGKPDLVSVLSARAMSISAS